MKKIAEEIEGWLRGPDVERDESEPSYKHIFLRAGYPLFVAVMLLMLLSALTVSWLIDSPLLDKTDGAGLFALIALSATFVYGCTSTLITLLDIRHEPRLTAKQMIDRR